MMKTRTRKGTGISILGLAVLAILILNPGCRKRSEAEEEATRSEARDRPETAEVQKEKAPVLDLMVNRLGEADAYQGWPVLVELDLRHPSLFQKDPEVETMVIAARGDSWARAINLVVTDLKGQTMGFPFKLKPQAEAALTLDAEKNGSLSWWLAGEDTAAIPEGDFRIVAKLDTSGVNKPGVWQGKAYSEPAILRISREPSALSEDQAEEKQILLAAFAQGAGDRVKAMAYADAILKARPESLQGLAFKAGLIEEGGDKMGAMKIYEKAIDVFHRKYPNADPPYELWDEYNRLVAELLKK
jgi:hypothetical protein